MRKARRSIIAAGFVIIGISAVLLSNALAQRSSRGGPGEQGDSQLEKPPVPKDDNEKMILGILEDLPAQLQCDRELGDPK